MGKAEANAKARFQLGNWKIVHLDVRSLALPVVGYLTCVLYITYLKIYSETSNPLLCAELPARKPKRPRSDHATVITMRDVVGLTVVIPC
jgi:hypothetical protein